MLRPTDPDALADAVLSVVGELLLPQRPPATVQTGGPTRIYVLRFPPISRQTLRFGEASPSALRQAATTGAGVRPANSGP
jgi:hypothetical protein